MTGEISSILQELVAVQDQLTSLPVDAMGEKRLLLSRREELQTRAARLADRVDESSATQELMTRLARLRRQREAIHRHQIEADLHSGPQRRGGGVRGRGAGPRSSANDGPDVNLIDSRIGRITRLLAERGIDAR